MGYTSRVTKDRTKTMPVMGHLGELRRRFTWIAAVLVVLVVVCFIEKDYIFAVLLHPLHQIKPGMKLATLGVTEPFMSVLKVSIYAGVIISLPVILYHFWAFILPGMYENEKRSVIPYMASTTVLFLAGVAFAYFIVLPVGLRFMVGYSTDIFTQLLQADRYITFVTMFMLAFGVVFELPLLMMLLGWAGIVSHVRMRKIRKYAILVEAIIAAVFTPSQDPLSMTLMLIPLIVLYELGIWLTMIATKRRAKRQAAAAAAEAAAAEKAAAAAASAAAAAAEAAAAEAVAQTVPETEGLQLSDPSPQ